MLIAITKVGLSIQLLLEAWIRIPTGSYSYYCNSTIVKCMGDCDVN